MRPIRCKNCGEMCLVIRQKHGKFWKSWVADSSGSLPLQGRKNKSVFCARVRIGYKKYSPLTIHTPEPRIVDFVRKAIQT